MKNISPFGFKILSASTDGKMLTFTLQGFLKRDLSINRISINGISQDIQLFKVDSKKVPFGPKLETFFNWECRASINKEKIDPFENKFLFDNMPNAFGQIWSAEGKPGLIIPPVENIKRVSGPTSNHHTYRNAGATEYWRYREVFQSLGINLNKKKVLDFGVGCGRVAQHFALDKVDITGVDIDAVNVSWCKENLQGIPVYLGPLQPPTQLSDEQFDIIISSSVFSHLTPDHWELFLAELNRVIKPGGFAFISFHGDHSCAVMAEEDLENKNLLESQGYLDAGASHDLGVEHEDYYRNVFYTDVTAKKLMETHFQVLEMRPSYVSGSQTLACLRARAN